MKNLLRQPHILLIRPPFSCSRQLPGQWSRIGPVLRPAVRNLQFNDAGTDYLRRSLLDSGHLKLMSDTVEAMPDSAQYLPVVRALTDMLDNDDRYADAMIRRLVQGDGETDTLRHLEMLRMLDGVLELASAAYGPCRFHRHGFSHPALNRAGDLVAFARDARGNPFYRFSMELWQPIEDSAPPDLALMYVGERGQTGPAATLVRAWQNRWPQIPLIVLRPERPGDDAMEEALPSSNAPLSPETDECVSRIRRSLLSLPPGVTLIDTHQELDEDQAGEFPVHPLIAEKMPASVDACLKHDCKLIVWISQGDDVDAVTRQLYAAARRGIWNHLVLKHDDLAELEQFAAANANIVHSYCRRQRALSAYSDSEFSYPSVSPNYGRTEPMPGKPIWMDFRDPGILNDLLHHYALKSLMRMRIRDNRKSLFEVGRNLTYAFAPPAELPDGYLDEVVRMVEAGGSVNTRFVRHNLERAYLVAYAQEEGVIIGNSCLKHPRDEYIDAVSRQSGIDLLHFLERGYTSVRPEYRGLGIGARLLEGLTRRAGDYKLFSVIAEGNIATQKMAIRNRTRRVATFFSERAQKEVSVWIPEWMLPEGIELPEQPDL